MDYFLCVIGMVMMIEGSPYFLCPEKIKDWIRQLLEIPDNALRVLGFVLMLTGLGLVYLGKN